VLNTIKDDYKEFVLGELTELWDYYWCLPVSPKPDSPESKLGLGVGVFQIRRNPIRRNPFRRN